jgi:hypothetical protein
MRQALHELLKRILAEAQVPVRLGTTVWSIEQSGDRVDVQFTGGARGHYDLLVGLAEHPGVFYDQAAACPVLILPACSTARSRRSRSRFAEQPTL